MKKVSIVLPTYNRDDFVIQAAESAISQTYENIELIVVDDCSDDSTWALLNKKLGQQPNVKLIRNTTRKGLPASRNVGINAAEGKLIYFMEDDLILERNLIDVLVKSYNQLSANYKVGAVGPRLIRVDHTSGLVPILVKTSLMSGDVEVQFNVAGKYTIEVPTLHSCVLISTALLKNAGGYAENCYTGNYLREESDLYSRLRSADFKFFYEPKAVTYHHIGHSGGCSLSFFKYFQYCVKNHLVFLVRFEKKRCFYLFPMYPVEFQLKYIERRSKVRLFPKVCYRTFNYFEAKRAC